MQLLPRKILQPLKTTPVLPAISRKQLALENASAQPQAKASKLLLTIYSF